MQNYSKLLHDFKNLCLQILTFGAIPQHIQNKESACQIADILSHMLAIITTATDPTMILQDSRDKTFSKVNWAVQYRFKQNEKKLSAAGLYATGKEDSCACFSCGLLLQHWEADDNSDEYHKKLSPKCLLVKIELAANRMVQPKFINSKQGKRSSFGYKFLLVLYRQFQKPYFIKTMNMGHSADLLTLIVTQKLLKRHHSISINHENPVFTSEIEFLETVFQEEKEILMNTDNKLIVLPNLYESIILFINSTRTLPNMDTITEITNSNNNNNNTDVYQNELSIPTTIVNYDHTESNTKQYQLNGAVQTSNLNNDNSGILYTETGKMLRSLRCINCLHKNVSSVFLPCGDLVMCRDCAEDKILCPVCGYGIDTKFTVYIC